MSSTNHRLALLISTLCLLIISLTAAPTADKSMVRKVQSLKQATSPEFEAKKRRRVKREVLFDELPVEDDDEASEQIDRQLAELSNEELNILGQIVQSQLDAYDPQMEEYEIIRIPRELLAQIDGDDDEQIDYFPRDRRSIPIEVEEDEESLEPQMVLVDESVVEEALENARRDELELRERIAELAALLNERALRGLSK